MIRPLALAAAALAAPAAAATWTPAPSLMVRTGACGYGGAVIGDGCAPVIAAGQPQLIASGQNLVGGLNGQDTNSAALMITGLSGALAVRLVLQDLHDQANSFGEVETGGVTYAFARGANAEVRVLDLGPPGGDAMLVAIRTRLNDGFTALALACRPDQ
jgi:hypothetical protein